MPSEATGELLGNPWSILESPVFDVMFFIFSRRASPQSNVVVRKGVSREEQKSIIAFMCGYVNYGPAARSE